MSSVLGKRSTQEHLNKIHKVLRGGKNDDDLKYENKFERVTGSQVQLKDMCISKQGIQVKKLPFKK